MKSRSLCFIIVIMIFSLSCKKQDNTSAANKSLVLEYTFKDAKTVVECLACIHDISETKAKSLLATKMSEIIQNISKED